MTNEQQPAVTVVRLPRAEVKRSVSPGMFADVCDAEAEFTTPGAALEVTFSAVLSADQVAQVQDRLLTTDTDQEEARATIRDLLGDGCCALCEATARYVLGDPTGETGGP